MVKHTRKHATKMHKKSMKVYPHYPDATFHGIQCWHKHLFEKLGWIVLAKKYGMMDKVTSYKTSIERLKSAIEMKIKNLRDGDKKEDMHSYGTCQCRFLTIFVYSFTVNKKEIQNSGSCFLNKQPCFNKFGIEVIIPGSCKFEVSNHILIIQKFFFGEMVIPFTCLLCAGSTQIVSPHNNMNKSRHTSYTHLLMTLYEKQPPLRFLGSSHMGVIP